MKSRKVRVMDRRLYETEYLDLCFSKLGSARNLVCDHFLALIFISCLKYEVKIFEEFFFLSKFVVLAPIRDL